MRIRHPSSGGDIILYKTCLTINNSYGVLFYFRFIFSFLNVYYTFTRIRHFYVTLYDQSDNNGALTYAFNLATCIIDYKNMGGYLYRTKVIWILLSVCNVYVSWYKHNILYLQQCIFSAMFQRVYTIPIMFIIMILI